MSKLIEQLKLHEGLRLHPYKCTAGKLTIGFGRNLDDKGITAREAEFMLENDVLYLLSVLPSKIKFFNQLDKVRADILVNMAFNIGIAGLLKFKKMISAMEREDWAEAANEMLDSKWANQVGDRAKELYKMMITGEYHD